jgi:hypothetical protein
MRGVKAAHPHHVTGRHKAQKHMKYFNNTLAHREYLVSHSLSSLIQGD